MWQAPAIVQQTKPAGKKHASRKSVIAKDQRLGFVRSQVRLDAGSASKRPPLLSAHACSSWRRQSLDCQGSLNGSESLEALRRGWWLGWPPVAKPSRSDRPAKPLAAGSRQPIRNCPLRATCPSSPIPCRRDSTPRHSPNLDGVIGRPSRLLNPAHRAGLLNSCLIRRPIGLIRPPPILPHTISEAWLCLGCGQA